MNSLSLSLTLSLSPPRYLIDIIEEDGQIMSPEFEDGIQLHQHIDREGDKATLAAAPFMTQESDEAGDCGLWSYPFLLCCCVCVMC